MIWFPTFTSLRLLARRRPAGRRRRAPGRGEDGKVLPEVKEIMEMAAEKKVGIGFGHTDFRGIVAAGASWPKTSACARRSIIRCLKLNKLLLDEMKQLRDLGVYVGTYCQPMIPSLYQPVADPMETIRTIKAIGPDRCIIGSDFGQVLHMDADRRHARLSSARCLASASSRRKSR